MRLERSRPVVGAKRARRCFGGKTTLFEYVCLDRCLCRYGIGNLNTFKQVKPEEPHKAFGRKNPTNFTSKPNTCRSWPMSSSLAIC